MRLRSEPIVKCLQKCLQKGVQTRGTCTLSIKDFGRAQGVSASAFLLSPELSSPGLFLLI